MSGGSSVSQRIIQKFLAMDFNRQIIVAGYGRSFKKWVIQKVFATPHVIFSHVNSVSTAPQHHHSHSEHSALVMLSTSRSMVPSTQACHTVSTTAQQVSFGTLHHAQSVSLLSAALTTTSHQREFMFAQNTFSTQSARKTSSSVLKLTTRHTKRQRPRVLRSLHQRDSQLNQSKLTSLSQTLSKQSQTHHSARTGKTFYLNAR